MSNNKQTSLDWFLDELLQLGYIKRLPVTELQQAKAMHKEEIDQSYRDGFEFALINECAKQSTSDASKYADGYSEGYKRALELIERSISIIKDK